MSENIYILRTVSKLDGYPYFNGMDNGEYLWTKLKPDAFYFRDYKEAEQLRTVLNKRCIIEIVR
jgi:hypothetical protein